MTDPQVTERRKPYLGHPMQMNNLASTKRPMQYGFHPILLKMRLLSVVFFICCMGCQDDDGIGETVNDETALIQPQWTVNLGRSIEIPFFPDAQSNYFTYAFQRTVTETSIIKITGQFPNARYFSIVVYDNDSRNPIAVLRDIEMIASANSQNPFLDRNFIPGQTYEVHISTNGVAIPAYPNPIVYDSKLTNISIFLRYYLPEVDDFGGVPLPQISAISPLGESVTAPLAESIENLVDLNDITTNLQLLGNTLFTLEPVEERQFFRANGDNSGNFSNPDNAYLLNASTLLPDEVIFLRWKSPMVSEHFGEFGSDDMRYLSVSLSNERSFNFSTMSDMDLHVADDGFINLVIARQDAEIIEYAQGLNYLQWPEDMGTLGYILYRNLLTNSNFDHSIALTRPISGNYLDFLAAPENYDARNFMGDFAPSGKKMGKLDFLNDFGGLKVSY